MNYILLALLSLTACGHPMTSDTRSYSSGNDIALCHGTYAGEVFVIDKATMPTAYPEIEYLYIGHIVVEATGEYVIGVYTNTSIQHAACE